MVMKQVVTWSLLGLLAVVLLVSAALRSEKDVDYRDFAKCLSEKNLTFYGAYWCPHCQRQKSMVGDAKDYLPYVECSLPGGKGQTQECQNAGVNAYPTWVFPDGTRRTGEVSLDVLSEKSGCSIPE
jgi:Zn ribbon nucleic-acid-binding protein